MRRSRIFRNSMTFQSLALLFSTAPTLCSFFILFEIVFSLIPIFSAKAISQIVNILTGFEDSQIQWLMVVVGFYIGINVAIQVLSPVRSMLAERLSDKVAKESEVLFNSKVASLYTIDRFENNQFFNQMQLAKDGCGARLISSLQMISSFLRGIITIVLTAGYMLNVHWLIGAISLFAVIPNSFYTFWVSKNKVALYRSRTESSRRLSYFSTLLSSPEYAKEVRLFGVAKDILHRYEELFNTEYRRINKIRKKQCFYGIFAASIGAIANGVAIILFINKAVALEIGAGSVVLYISMLPQFIGGLQMLINSVTQTKNNNYYIKHFFDFINMDFEEKNGTSFLNQEKEGIRKIAVNNLTFKYPNSEHYAIKNVNFSVHSPALVAIVGENGAGKSTLIKLLTRLFNATEGQIMINDAPIEDYDINALRKTMSGVFQDPARFAFSFRENILLACQERNKSDEEILEACRKADVLELINGSPNGFDTILGKQFEGGIDLSSGQWQKISLARAFMSNASILFFDEAAADLDPKAEQIFYRGVKEYASNRIAFYITHRLSGTKDADLIIVLKNGEIVEIGKHRDLIKYKGEYYRLYHAQADGYETQ